MTDPEYDFIISQASSMADALEHAKTLSPDPYHGPPPSIKTVTHRGKRGRPKIDIDPVFLAYSLSLRGPGKLASILACSSKTIRRRALEHRLVEPCPVPVFQAFDQGDGTVQEIWTSVGPPISVLNDNPEQLDQAVRQILDASPKYGREMLYGALRGQGHQSTREKIGESYLRVHRAPPTFGRRRIERRQYWVPGANSLWHHDGHHGMFLGLGLSSGDPVPNSSFNSSVNSMEICHPRFH